MLTGVKGPIYDLKYACLLSRALEVLSRNKYDIILLDTKLPDSIGLGSFRRVQSRAPEAAIIVLAEAVDEQTAFSAVKEGAQDYLIRNQFEQDHLVRTIQNSIWRKHDSLLKEEFISDASHELRTPLAILKIAISNLRKGMESALSEEQEKMLRIAEVNVDRLVKFINNLLDLARLESGRENIHRRDMNLEPVIHETVQSFQIEAREIDVSLEVDVRAPLPTLCADEYMMERVINNLLSNALRFAKKKVTVRARARDEEYTRAMRIRHTGENGEAVHPPDSDCILVSVIDDGEGIPEEEIGDLFNKFAQLKNMNESEGYKGTGLGLAICREIVNQHKGAIWAESVLDRGTGFHFIIPRKNGSPS